MIETRLEIQATAKLSDQSGLFRVGHFSTVDMSEAKFISGDGLETVHMCRN